MIKDLKWFLKEHGHDQKTLESLRENFWVCGYMEQEPFEIRYFSEGVWTTLELTEELFKTSRKRTRKN
jgi:hypothetical protein